MDDVTAVHTAGQMPVYQPRAASATGAPLA